MPKRDIILFYLLILAGAGCAVLRHPQELWALRRLGQSQDKIARYVERQERLFERLVGDVQANKLEPGRSRSEIIKSYGEPVLSRKISGDPLVDTRLLYRHPTQYFSSHRIYLYFDERARLVYWEYEPCKEAAE
jgi:hypothetical protein